MMIKKFNMSLAPITIVKIHLFQIYLNWIIKSN